MKRLFLNLCVVCFLVLGFSFSVQAELVEAPTTDEGAPIEYVEGALCSFGVPGVDDENPNEGFLDHVPPTGYEPGDLCYSNFTKFKDQVWYENCTSCILGFQVCTMHKANLECAGGKLVAADYHQATRVVVECDGDDDNGPSKGGFNNGPGQTIGS